MLRSFRYGSSGLLARLFRPRIETLLFAASKADHVAHNQHHNLRLLLERMVADAAGARALRGHHAGLRGARGAALDRRGAHRAPRPGAVLRARRLKGENRETVLFPGEIPPELPAEEDWQAGRFRFRDFAPRRLLLHGADKPQHIRLDQALEMLIGDRLQ